MCTRFNPDLENPASTFFLSQCGNFDPVKKPFGFISGATLDFQTRHHEYAGHPQSHYAELSKALEDPNNNLGDYLESRISAPGTNHNKFQLDTAKELGRRAQAIVDAASVEPFAVNESETGDFLGNINYLPYQPCN